MRRTPVALAGFMYSGYYKGSLFYNQLVHPKQKVPHGGPTYRRVLQGPHGTAAAPAAATQDGEDDGKGRVSWEGDRPEDPVGAAAPSAASAASAGPRPYVAMDTVLEVELQGDYFIEGGHGEDALKYYGVVAKAYEATLPDDHINRALIYIKLGRAFRYAGRHEAAILNLERALSVCDATSTPQVEVIVEALLELGAATAASGGNAGPVYEDALEVVSAFHDLGTSHRVFRHLPRLAKKLNFPSAPMIRYHSPFTYDRTFALTDSALHQAEVFYRGADDAAGVHRVLLKRRQLMDRKFFNMRTFAGKMRTTRGRPTIKIKYSGNAPTNDETLALSPTVHQVHFDHSLLNNAPLGSEDDVMPGLNRKVMDDGDPMRRVVPYDKYEARRKGFKNHVQQMSWD